MFVSSFNSPDLLFFPPSHHRKLVFLTHSFLHTHTRARMVAQKIRTQIMEFVGACKKGIMRLNYYYGHKDISPFSIHLLHLFRYQTSSTLKHENFGEAIRRWLQIITRDTDASIAFGTHSKITYRRVWMFTLKWILLSYRIRAFLLCRWLCLWPCYSMAVARSMLSTHRTLFASFIIAATQKR